MLIDIVPSHSKNGIIGKYKTANAEKFFAVVLAENMSPDKREAIIRSTQSSIASQRKTGAHNAEQVLFESETDISPVVNDRLNKDTDVIFVCPDKATYVETCTIIGITRADHLMAAEFSCQFIEPSKEKFVAGSAHSLRDRLIHERNQAAGMARMARDLLKKSGKTDSSLTNGFNKLQKLNQIADRFIAQIPQATKFSLGTVKDNKSFMKCPTEKPWLFRLPFKKCLFEVEGEAPAEMNMLKSKAFVLATQTEDENIFRAEIMIVDPRDGTPYPQKFFIVWDISGKELKIGRHFYDEKDAENLDPGNEMNSKFVIISLFPFIAKLNDMKSVIQKIHPPALPHQPKNGESPFYDYHVLVPSPRTEGTPEAEGEHTPKRLHMRRGHYRNYNHDRFTNMKGQTRWIEEKIWGNENMGVLGKEYDLTHLQKNDTGSENISPEL